MSDNYIQAIERDKYGFMWFATRDGLNRYDGYHFKTYTTLRQGAYNNSVEWVAEDAAGNIWIKTPVNYCFMTVKWTNWITERSFFCTR